MTNLDDVSYDRLIWKRCRVALETTEPKLLSVIFLFYVSLEKMNDQKSSRMQCNEDNQDSLSVYAIPKRIQTITLPEERRCKQRNICP